MSERELRRLRRRMQIVFQDPHASLNPAMTIEQSVGHPLEIHGVAKGVQRRQRVAEALETVGLSPAEQFIDKYPSDLSGGQKQRAVIARAIILNPVLLVADEPVSMLDMSVRAKILQLMLHLKHEFGFTYLYITHDLGDREVLLRPHCHPVPRSHRRDRARRRRSTRIRSTRTRRRF
jgi:peptide/nickel transport system ATP-binding protein